MDKSCHLRLGDVRAALRLVGECRDLGYDPALWMRHAFDGLCRLVGARVVMGGEAYVAGPVVTLVPIYSVLVGLPEAGEPTLVSRLREGGLKADVIGTQLQAIPGPHQTRSRRQLLPDRAWYGSLQYDGYHRPAGIDHCVASQLELPGGRAFLTGIHRAVGERDFSARELK